MASSYWPLGLAWTPGAGPSRPCRAQLLASSLAQLGVAWRCQPLGLATPLAGVCPPQTQVQLFFCSLPCSRTSSISGHAAAVLLGTWKKVVTQSGPRPIQSIIYIVHLFSRSCPILFLGCVEVLAGQGRIGATRQRPSPRILKLYSCYLSRSKSLEVELPGWITRRSRFYRWYYRGLQYAGFQYGGGWECYSKYI